MSSIEARMGVPCKVSPSLPSSSKNSPSPSVQSKRQCRARPGRQSGRQSVVTHPLRTGGKLHLPSHQWKFLAQNKHLMKCDGGTRCVCICTSCCFAAALQFPPKAWRETGVPAASPNPRAEELDMHRPTPLARFPGRVTQLNSLLSEVRSIGSQGFAFFESSLFFLACFFRFEIANREAR